jgi:hypothetical protein
MATVAELQARLSSVERQIDANLDKVAALTREQDSIKAQRQRLFAGGDRAGAAALRAQENAIDDQIASLQSQDQAEAATLRREIAGAEAKQANESTPQPAPPATASQTAADDAAKGPNAPEAQQTAANGRVTPPPDTTSPSNAEPPAITDAGGGDSGTDAPVRTTEQTQATGPASNSGQAVVAPNTAPNAAQVAPAKLVTQPGTPTRDDAAQPMSAANQNSATQDYTSIKIVPRANPLDNYHSYSYSISVYMITPTQYETLLRSKIKKIDGYFLLFQSGGAGINVGGVRTGMGSTTNATNNQDSGRNPFFGDDFYIEGLTLETTPLGKATGASQMANSMKITVAEPSGMTLIDRLYKACENLQQGAESGKVNYTAADYLTVIRFYGYDESGNIVYPIRSLGEVSGSSDPKAVIEKFIPFKIAGINWSVGSKLVTYEWDCVPNGIYAGGMTGRGAIPYDVQLTDSTVQGLLGAGTKFSTNTPPASNPGASTTPAADDGSYDRAETSRLNRQSQAAAPAKATAAPTAKKTITQGLMGALNEYQKALVTRGIFKIADEYSIEFQGIPGVPAAAIADATLKPIGQVKDDKAKTAAGAPAEKNTQSLKQDTNTVDSVSQSFSITAGQMITQAIELTIRNSSYISNQQLVIVQTDGTSTPNPNARNKPVSWFIITMFATAQPGGIDPLRNDYAYKIKYVVRPFIPSSLNSKYFPASKFNGIHKRYPYWFTGQNTAVLEYQETLNALYSITVSGNDPKNSAAAVQKAAFTSSATDIAKYNYAPRSNQTSSGQKGKVNEPAANAAEYLFSPGDLANTKVKIIGDPDWIQQGSLFQEIKEGENTVEVLSGFAPDGSISFETGDVLFEMVWQRPEDYNIDTGLADPYSGGYSGNTNTTREAIQSRTYYAVKVVSEFRGGKFEQTIEGTLFLFPVPKATASASAAAGAAAGTGANAANASTSANDGNAGEAEARENMAPGAASSPGSDAGLSPAAAQQARSDYAVKDPRLLTSTDGGQAAILGAQGAFNNVGVANQFSKLATVEPGALANLGPGALANFGASLLPAGSPQLPTSGTGGTISAVVESIGTGPPKLPQVGAGQTNLTVTQIVGQLNQAAASIGPRRSAAPGTTASPSTQQIVKEA